MAVQQYDDEILKEALVELRLTYQRLDTSHAQVKSKILIMLGGGLGLMSFLYGGGDVFIPPQTYGKIVYFIGLGLVLSALYFLFRCVRKIFWHVPTENHFHNMLDEHETKNHFLNYLVDEYTNALTNNIPRYELKQSHLDIAFMQLISGGILLLIIKSFGG